jgi:hypothetical protein
VAGGNGDYCCAAADGNTHPGYANGASDRDLDSSTTAHGDVDAHAPAHLDADPHAASRADGDGHADACCHTYAFSDRNRDAHACADGNIGV